MTCFSHCKKRTIVNMVAIKQARSSLSQKKKKSIFCCLLCLHNFYECIYAEQPKRVTGLSGSAAVPVCCVSVSGLRRGRHRGGLRWVPHHPPWQHHAHGPGAWTDMETTAGMFHQRSTVSISYIVEFHAVLISNPPSRVLLCWNLKATPSLVMGET